MKMPITLFIALRYWRSKNTDRFARLVTNLASTGIVLGVMALIIVLSVMNGLERQQKQQVLSTIPHAIISPAQNLIQIDDKPPVLPAFVSTAVPINRTNVIFQTAQGLNSGEVLGVSSFNDDPQLALLSTEQFDQLLPQGEFKLIISYLLAQQLELNIGDKIRLIISENSQYTPFGRVPMQRLFTVSEIYYNQNKSSAYTAFANLADIGRLMAIPPSQAQGYRLFLTDPFLITELANYFPHWQIQDWREQKGEFFQAVRMEKNMMSLLISLIIIVAISNIVTSLSLMVVDKQGEIAILQTQGLKKGQIQRIFIYQGLLVGFAGTLIGILLGIIISLNLNAIVDIINPNSIFLPVLLEPSQIILIVAFSLLLSLVSTLYPAYQSVKIEPAEALRYE